ncbi:hypothetical protein OAF53_01495, partial [Akkermansiaceae bacterium]|nr:hypothetical protein [Akkermansiaceae bacterium]
MLITFCRRQPLAILYQHFCFLLYASRNLDHSRIMRFALIAVLCLGSLHAQDEEKKKDSQKEEITKATHQDSVTIDGKKIEYRATAANLLLKNSKDENRASIFHVSYERLGIKDRSKRPVMFAFNGGPGSSAVWLHLGALGPR